MMRSLFLFLVFVHGLIHLLGVAKAFGWAEVPQLTKAMARPMGWLWLLAALLQITTASLFLARREEWWAMAVLAVIISQLLIFLYWQDAKYGTIANIILLVVALPAYGKWQFDRQVQLESQLIQSFQTSQERDIAHLPNIVQQWLRHSGVIGKEMVRQVAVRQVGRMKTKPAGAWMPFEARQRFNVEEPAFLWSTKVNMGPLLYLVGRDRFYKGEGAMTIKLLSLFKVVDEGPNEKINQATMLRFLSEICWFPSAALSPYISWTAIDSASVKATMHYEGSSVSGVFTFSEAGDFLSFSAQRYYGGGEEATLEEWLVEAVDHKTVGGYRIPYKSKVTWLLEAGDFHWLDVEITDLDINTVEQKFFSVLSREFW